MFHLKNTIQTTCTALIIATSLSGANIVIDNFNQGQTQASNTVWAPQTGIGWYYTPTTSYSLVGLNTIFTQSNSSSDTDRLVSIGIYTNRPAAGGTLLGGGTFNSSTARGVYGGATFAGISLTAGTSYFVAFSNILSLGVNQVSFTPNSGPPGSVAVGATWTNVNDNFNTAASNGTTWFDKPVLQFLGPGPVGNTPEPATWTMLAGGAGLLALIRRKR